MALQVRLDGAAQLRQVAAQIRATGDKGLGREMSAALRKATRPVQAAVRREAEAVMPTGGGYRNVVTRSLKFRLSVRTSARRASLTLRTFAAGKGERRDIRALNAGRLRHPVFGRSRTVRGRGRVPNPWAVTRIRSGFHDRGTAAAADEAVREIRTVLDDFASRLLKG